MVLVLGTHQGMFVDSTRGIRLVTIVSSTLLLSALPLAGQSVSPATRLDWTFLGAGPVTFTVTIARTELDGTVDTLLTPCSSAATDSPSTLEAIRTIRKAVDQGRWPSARVSSNSRRLSLFPEGEICRTHPPSYDHGYPVIANLSEGQFYYDATNGHAHMRAKRTLASVGSTTVFSPLFSPLHQREWESAAILVGAESSGTEQVLSYTAKTGTMKWTVRVDTRGYPTMAEGVIAEGWHSTAYYHYSTNLHASSNKVWLERVERYRRTGSSVVLDDIRVSNVSSGTNGDWMITLPAHTVLFDHRGDVVRSFGESSELPDDLVALLRFGDSSPSSPGPPVKNETVPARDSEKNHVVPVRYVALGVALAVMALGLLAYAIRRHRLV